VNTKYSSKAVIIHDASGEIVSVGRVPENLRGRLEVKPSASAHSVLEVELDPHEAAMTPGDLHKNYKVHVASKKIVKK
jgi:hypothetical protein